MKLKSHKATTKRVKATKGGKLVRVKSAKSHLLTHKNDPTKQLLEINTADKARIKKLAPYL
ncbi:MAG: bL35 family ribosomal protein [Patescibacteria group bacterium]